MAYSNSTSDRMDELRFRTQQSPRNDSSSLLGLVSPPRNGTRIPQPLQAQDSRGGLMRRFTTDSGRVPTIASLASQRGGQEPQDYGPSVRYCPFNYNCYCSQTINNPILPKLNDNYSTIVLLISEFADISQGSTRKQSFLRLTSYSQLCQSHIS